MEEREKFGENCVRGEICIDGFVEIFFSPLVFWRKIDYYKSWVNQLAKLNFSNKTFLPTTMYIPERANFIFGWSIYIEDECAYLQNNMIAAENISGKINIDALNEAMPLRATFDDENREISEWKTTRLSVFDFSNRLKQKLKM
jgi:hypothetical protein